MHPTPRTPESASLDLRGDSAQMSAASGKGDLATEQSHRGVVVVHDLDGLLVQRDDALRMLSFNGNWLRLSPLEYLIVLPLLEYFKQYVSSATLLQVAYGCSYDHREARRLAKVMHRIRPKLALYDLIIDTVVSTSYRPWGYILQRATTRDAIQAFPRLPFPC